MCVPIHSPRLKFQQVYKQTRLWSGPALYSCESNVLSVPVCHTFELQCLNITVQEQTNLLLVFISLWLSYTNCCEGGSCHFKFGARVDLVIIAAKYTRSFWSWFSDNIILPLLLNFDLPSQQALFWGEPTSLKRIKIRSK